MTDTSFRRVGRVLPLLMSLCLAALACAKPLYQPPPIAGGATPEQTRAAILRALAQSYWSVDSEQPGQVMAHYSNDDWMMAVAIDYANQVTIRYANSENLDYAVKNGAPVIHGGYNKRVGRLSKVIGREIAMVRASEPLPAVAAPPPSRAPAQ